MRLCGTCAQGVLVCSFALSLSSFDFLFSASLFVCLLPGLHFERGGGLDMPDLYFVLPIGFPPALSL
jgi:hypothetical protein